MVMATMVELDESLAMLTVSPLVRPMFPEVIIVRIGGEKSYTKYLWCVMSLSNIL